MTLMGGLLSLDIYSKYKDASRKMRGNESSICFLKKQLEKEKEKLKELKDNKDLSNISVIEESSTSKKVDDEKQLKRLNYLDSCYYECGFNEKKYLKYLAKGTLRQILHKKCYPLDRIGFIEGYINDVSAIPNREKAKAKALLPKKSTKS